jgi:FixJ family two-component response regulator
LPRVQQTARPLIAIVDDEESVRTAFRRLLSSAGFRSQSYASGAALLESARSNRPDCLILDLHMPGMSGFEVQSRLKGEGVELPVVVITGHDTPESEARAREGGCVAYLSKPVDDQVLLDAVAIALSGKSRD